jgi:hypothetical protein
VSRVGYALHKLGLMHLSSSSIYHATIYVSSYCYICVLEELCLRRCRRHTQDTQRLSLSLSLSLSYTHTPQTDTRHTETLSLSLSLSRSRARSRSHTATDRHKTHINLSLFLSLSLYLSLSLSLTHTLPQTDTRQRATDIKDVLRSQNSAQMHQAKLV